MPTSNSQWPINWGDYEHGRSPRQGSVGSFGSRVQFDESATPDRGNNARTDDQNGENSGEGLRRRRSSLSMRLSSVAQAGGVNSLENFARSWSRAANFLEIPQRPAVLVTDQDDEDLGTRRSNEPFSPTETRGLLRQQLERQGTQSSSAVDEEAEPLIAREEDMSAPGAAEGLSTRPSGAFDRSQFVGSPFSSSYGGVYGSLSSRIRDVSARPPTKIYYEARGDGDDLGDESDRLLVKVVEQEDGSKIQVVVGRSTLPQTVFNSINVLIGVGLLSLPLGMKQSGWLIGMLFMVFAALGTRYSAGVLAKCLDTDPALVTFSDLAWKAFGSKARIAVGLLFTLELIAACVALVILFADSLYALFPQAGVIEWKILCGLVMIPLSFVPLRFLSFTSVLGIISCLGIAILIFVDGFIKPRAPGSLRNPALAPVFPERWSELPLSFGLLMSPWGGHSVFPNIYRDMRHPQKYPRAVNYTYVFTYILDVAVAVAGYLMFGLRVHDEITSDIFLTKGYPRAVAIIIIVFISIIPITKIPLNARPVIVVVEAVCGVSFNGNSNSNSNNQTPPNTTEPTTSSPPSSNDTTQPHRNNFLTKSLKTCISILPRVLVLFIITLLAIVVPGFDTVMALLGSAMAFSICLILPLAFNLKLFAHQLSMAEKMANWVLMAVCAGMAAVGTVWVFLPRGLREGLDGF